MIGFQQRTLIHAPIQRCFDLARSIDVHLEANSKYREQTISKGLASLGQRIIWRARHFGIWQTLTSEMTACRPPAHFQNTMRAGVFKSMQADHYFRTMSSGATEMVDHFRVTAPYHLLGRLAELLALHRYLAAINRHRCQVIKEIAESTNGPS